MVVLFFAATINKIMNGILKIWMLEETRLNEEKSYVKSRVFLIKLH